MLADENRKSRNFSGKGKILKILQTMKIFSKVGGKSETGGNASWPQGGWTPLVLGAAARMIGGVPKVGHISEFMRDTLHWPLSCSAFTIGSPPLFGVVSLALRLLIGILYPDFVLNWPTISSLCLQR